MSFYDGPSWQAPGRQTSWEQPPPSRSGASSSAATTREDGNAFLSQIEEVEKAIDNLNKSGKLFPMQPRRDSFPHPGGMGRGGGFNDFAGPARHHSLDFDPMRSHSGSNAQGFYANQRFQTRHGGSGEVDAMQQAKRRMAAARERELRNYHQEQQYNRKGKSDRSNSPSVMNEEERRELIARQHRALYGGDGLLDSNKFGGSDGNTPRPGGQATGSASGRGPSPMAFNNFGSPDPSQSADETKGSSPKPTGTRSRSNSNSSPASNNNQQNFSLFESTGNAQQSSRTSTSSPGGSPNRAGKSQAPAPIGTRPMNPALNKRGTPPTSSPLSFGFAPNETGAQGERAGSSASNPPTGGKEGGSSGAWGSGSGVWGKGALGGVQASVWG